jgi:hypothetical protein
MGSRAGSDKTAARRVGLSLEAYGAKVAGGEKWCTGCKAWHHLAAFPVDRTRGDGRRARCLVAARGRPHGKRDREKDRARAAVRREVLAGRLSRPDLVPCSDCAHIGAERRHEYDHHQGHDAAHALIVQAVCTLCHATREKVRRG